MKQSQNGGSLSEASAQGVPDSPFAPRRLHAMGEGDSKRKSGSMTKQTSNVAKAIATSPKAMADLTRQASNSVSHRASEAIDKSAETAAAVKLQAIARGHQARSSIATAKKGVVKEVLIIKSEVLEGQDGLGAIVGSVSRQNKHVDTALHCANGIGFKWADQHRIKVMVCIQVIGALCFAFALCGAQGLSPHSMSVLPWAVIRDTDITAYDFLWWVYGPSGIESHLAANHTNGAYDRFFDNSVTLAFLNGLPDGQGAATFAPQGDSFENLKTINIMKGTWAFNQWGVCLFSGDTNNRALVALTCCSTHPYLRTDEEGICRAWNTFTPSWSREIDVCATGGVDSFSLIMGAFGAFMKICEPIARMKRSTDSHQKTIVLIIIGVSSIPALLGVVGFSLGCMVSVQNFAVSDARSFNATWGRGATLFLVSVLLLIPIFFLHLIVPAGKTTARAPTTSPALKETSTEVTAENVQVKIERAD